MKNKNASSKRRIARIGVKSGVVTLGALGLLLVATLVTRTRRRTLTAS